MKKSLILLILCIISNAIIAEKHKFYRIQVADFYNYILGPSEEDSTKNIYHLNKPVCVMVCIDCRPTRYMYGLICDSILPDYGDSVDFCMILDEEQYRPETSRLLNKIYGDSKNYPKTITFLLNGYMNTNKFKMTILNGYNPMKRQEIVDITREQLNKLIQMFNNKPNEE